MERGVIGIKNQSINWQNPSQKKGQQQRQFTIKIRDPDEITTWPEEVRERWTYYFSNLLNVETQGNDDTGESRLEDTMYIELIH